MIYVAPIIGAGIVWVLVLAYLHYAYKGDGE